MWGDTFTERKLERGAPVGRVFRMNIARFPAIVKVYTRWLIVLSGEIDLAA